jgi:uncharacterized membrane-anchored protein
MRGLWTASAVGLALLCVQASPAFAAPPAPPTRASVTALEKSLDKQTGDVTVPGANAVLHLGEKYYYLNAADARRVLVDLWGNPPDAADGVLGMVMPADTPLIDNLWGAVITFKDSGYVSDSDANTADYDKILTDLRSGETESNEERTKSGYPAIHLIGWAQPPSYDKATHSLIWARDLKFDGGSADTLNYDVRLLGRKGVLSLNMISDMPHLPEVRAAAATFGKTVEFQRGSTYAEFDGKVDKAAGYGLAGLVAAGVGLAVAKKIGFLALLLPFLKWIVAGFAVVAASMRKFIGNLFGRNRDTLEG